MKPSLLPLVIFVSSVVTAETCFSWGGRGHHSICDAAVYLVKNEGLAVNLRTKPHMMGHLCNLPDTYWKNIGGDAVKLGSPAHYLDPEVIGMSIAAIPLDFKKLVETYANTESKFKPGKKILDFPSEFGSNWWRADQFYRLATSFKSKFKETPEPKTSQEEFDDNHPFNMISFEFITHLGLMGHFVGDNAQPFHLTADYDGYGSGHGGLHAYYEEAVVSALPYNLQGLVVEEGQRIQKSIGQKNVPKDLQFLKEKSVLEKMRGLAVASAAEMPQILKLDKISKPSSVKEEKGMQLKIPAERPPASQVAKAYQTLVIREMARAACMLAQLWDQAYEEVGKPSLKTFRSYKYPLTPDFVVPDYF